jgi:hypothetical protein
MGETLDVNSGETYTVPSGETEAWENTDVDGTLQVDGTLRLEEGATGVQDKDDRFNLGTGDGLDLPLGPLNFSSMNVGVSVFIIGMIGVLGSLATIWKNYVAMAIVGLAVIAMLLSGLLGIGLELFWIMLVLSLVALVIGVMLQW